MGQGIPSETIRAEALFQVRLLREVIGFQPDGRPYGVHAACAEANVGVTTYYRHQRENTPEWQDAQRAIAELCRDETLMSEARARVSRLLTSGQDGPAAMVATRLLGLAEHTKQDHSVDLRTMVEQVCGSHTPRELAAVAELAAACDVGTGPAGADGSEDG